MPLPKRRWGRLDEENQIVEFTNIDPLGRFHPSIRWVEVDKDTKIGTRLTLFGSEVYYDPNEYVGQPVDLNEVFKQMEEERKKAEERLNNPKPITSDLTVYLDEEMQGF
jgi:hypothetical protein